jgi:restriction system protein
VSLNQRRGSTVLGRLDDRCPSGQSALLDTRREGRLALLSGGSSLFVACRLASDHEAICLPTAGAAPEVKRLIHWQSSLSFRLRRVEPSDLPPYKDFLLPVLRAVHALGGTAHAKEITAWIVQTMAFDDDSVTLEYPNRPGESILLDRIAWARSYDKLGGVVETPQRGLYVLNAEGKRVVSLPDADALQFVDEMDRQVRRARARQKPKDVERTEPDTEADPEPLDAESGEEGDALDLKAALLGRLHALTPRGFEDFVVHLLKSYGMELARVGGPTDEGVDAIGLAPVSDVLADRVAVQIKRYDPNGSRNNIERRDVALFQRDASAKGAERAIFVTLGSFSQAARKAATDTTPHVNLIDGERIWDLVEKKEIGLRRTIVLDSAWFERFD